MTSPTQADREAAANTLGRFGKWGMAELVSEGSEDNHPIVEAIAQARAEGFEDGQKAPRPATLESLLGYEAGYAQGERDMQEAAAKVAETTEAFGASAPFVKVACSYIAEEIRALSLKGPSQ